MLQKKKGRGEGVPQVAVVSSIVSTHQMAKCRLAMSPVVSLAQSLGTLDLRDLVAERVVCARRVERFNGRMRRGFVHRHVENAKV